MEGLPTELKYMGPFLMRAQELKSRDPVMSYYCTYYAVQQGITKGPKNPSTNAYLGALMDSLEEQKEGLRDNETMTNDVVAAAHIENFALKIFLNADNEDRAGQATKKTAKTFLAASTFLELLRIFGDVEPEIEDKIKYSKWKAAEIMKAIKEGRKPEAGPPEEAQGDQVMSGPDADAAAVPPQTFGDEPMAPPPSVPEISQPVQNIFPDFPSVPTAASGSKGEQWPAFPIAPSDFPTQDAAGHAPSLEQHSSSNQVYQPSISQHDNLPSVPTFLPPQLPAHVPSSDQYSPGNPSAPGFPQAPRRDPHPGNVMPSPKSYQPSYGTSTQNPALSSATDRPAKAEVDPTIVAQAQKHAKWAISSLNFEDVKTAREYLVKALQCLDGL
ncbi:hypothetical protein BZG36_00956 [Bifiguratus adelaidae]|uniref:Vta1/callose synthase N-terminal domain-containing protein n=1 Tax=Bifiguratus adelaidae TaxID=1938954 RepID=A0A261Y5I0_9FUNG|nr:hypothetical protein BZG36_00956 [Bifiguratus adelaidae]